MKSTSRTLTNDELRAFARELDELGREVAADLGQRDVDHIRAVIRVARQTEAGGRLLLHFGLGPVSFAAGVAALSTAKILENLFPEIPASRYPEMAPRVRAICERYGQSYNTGSLTKQLGSVARRIFKHALPSLARRPDKGRRTSAGLCDGDRRIRPRRRLDRRAFGLEIHVQ